MSRKRKTNSAELTDGTIQLRGLLELQLHNAKTGAPIGERINLNTVVTSGRSWVLSRLKSTSPATETISYMAIGTGTAAPTTANTALGSETTRLAIGTFTTTGMSSSPPSWRAETTFATDQGNTTLGEAGLFNSSSVGTMLSRVTFTTIKSYLWLCAAMHKCKSFLIDLEAGMANRGEELCFA